MSCKALLRRKYKTPVARDVVFAPYTTETVNDSDNLHLVTPKAAALPSFSVSQIVKIYPPFDGDVDTDVGARNSFFGCVLAPSNRFVKVHSYGLMQEEENYELRPYTFAEHVNGDHFGHAKLKHWTWRQMVSFILQLVLALRDGENLATDFVYGNLVPNNILLLESSKQTTTAKIDVSPDRIVNVYPPLLKLYDNYAFSTNTTFKEPCLKQDMLKPMLGVPHKVIQFVAEHLGSSVKAVALARRVNRFYAANQLVPNPDVRVLNMYIGMFQYLSGRKRLNTTMFLTSSWINELATNPMFRFLETTTTTTTTRRREPINDNKNHNVHRQVVDKLKVLLPLFGMSLPTPETDLYADLNSLERQYHREFGRYTTADVFHWCFDIRIPMIKGKHIANTDVGRSMVASVLAGGGELTLRVTYDEIYVCCGDDFNLQLTFPDVSDVFPRVASAGSNHALVVCVDKVGFNFAKSTRFDRFTIIDKNNDVVSPEDIHKLLPRTPTLLKTLLNMGVLDNSLSYSLCHTTAKDVTVTRYTSDEKPLRLTKCLIGEIK